MVKRSRTLLERRWLRVREEHVVLPTGVEIEEFHLIDGSDWAATLALTDDRRVVLVEQYRHGLGAVSRELPAGVIDPGEEARGAAERELLEETGMAAGAWEPLYVTHTEPSRHTNRAHFFLARGARAVARPRPESTESLRVVLVPVEEVLAGLGGGLVTHGLHVAALLLAERAGALR